VESADVEFETRSFPNLLAATLATLPSLLLIPISSIRSEHFLGFFAGTHDRELVPIIVKFIHHNRLMMNELKLD
jgi:hypothetical protein